MTNNDHPLAITHLIKWKETCKLSFELAEVSYTLLDIVIDYCKKNGIPIFEAEGIWNLVKKGRQLFKLIEEVNSPNYKPPKLSTSNEFLQANKSDEDFTEPTRIMLKYWVECE